MQGIPNHNFHCIYNCRLTRPANWCYKCKLPSANNNTVRKHLGWASIKSPGRASLKSSPTFIVSASDCPLLASLMHHAMLWRIQQQQKQQQFNNQQQRCHSNIELDEEAMRKGQREQRMSQLCKPHTTAPMVVGDINKWRPKRVYPVMSCMVIRGQIVC